MDLTKLIDRSVNADVVRNADGSVKSILLTVRVVSSDTYVETVSEEYEETETVETIVDGKTETQERTVTKTRQVEVKKNRERVWTNCLSDDERDRWLVGGDAKLDIAKAKILQCWQMFAAEETTRAGRETSTVENETVIPKEGSVRDFAASVPSAIAALEAEIASAKDTLSSKESELARLRAIPV